MADNSMENLISNYGDMSIEELGSSLLQRQSDIAEQRAKEAKKNRRFQQAIGLLTAGQAIFKNATQKRLKELDELQSFNMQDNVEQSQQIKTLGRIGANMPNQEWFAERKDMDVNTITKEILNDDRYGKNLQQNLAPVIDAAIKQGVPEEEYAMFKSGTSEYDTAFQLGLHNLISNYVSPHVDAKGNKTGKRNFEMYETELRKLLNERDLDSAKLFEQAIAITPGRLNQAEKRYYARLKSEYANRGYIESFKDIFKKIGNREEQQGRFNLFRNVEQTDLYGSDINDILTTLNIEGPLITSIDKSLAQYRGSATQALVSAKTDPDLVSRANTAIETYGRNLGNKRLYNSDNTLKMSIRGEGSWNRYTEDFTDSQKQKFAEDVAGLANSFQDDTDFALAVFSSTLKDRGEEVTDDMLAEFYQKITGPDNETYRLNIATAVAANEGFAAGGGFLGRKPEYYRDSFDTVAQKYKYDRFKGSIPTLLGEGISVPSQTTTGNYQEDASYSKMDKDSRKIAFDNQLKFIEQSKLSPTSKMKLIENLFENVRQPEFTTPQEYLEAYPPESRKPQYRYVYMSGPTGGYTARIPVNIPEKKNNVVSSVPVNNEVTNLISIHLEEKNKDGTSRFTYDNIDKVKQDLNELGAFIMEVESDGNIDAANPKSSARGLFQFTKDASQTAMNRVESKLGKQERFNQARQSGDVRDLSAEDQTLLFYGDILEKKGSDALIQKFIDADNSKDKKDAAFEIYKVLHHTGKLPLTASMNTKRKLRKYFN
jgi:hypothetical protein